MAKAPKLLERMRRSLDGWGQDDLRTLYKGFGFEIDHGGSHDIAIHPEYPDLRGNIPRHNHLAKGFINHAIKIIDDLKKRKGL